MARFDRADSHNPGDSGQEKLARHLKDAWRTCAAGRAG
jgi:hypothetical protein